MSSKKEEERNEKIIRGLMKLPPNRRCINCNSLGPQYVCTNFWTFVCTICSGIHREFTHRVKSVSMSKFTSQEVEALQRGGNQRARDIFFTEWDPQRYKLPNSSNVERIREFIKNVYVDRRYAVARSSDKPLRDMQGSKNQEEENRRASSYHSFSQSPPYEHQYEDRRYGKLPGALTRKGSDRGPYIGRLSTFVYGPSRLGGQVMFEDRFANEFPGSRVSEYSAASTSDRFRDVKSTNFQRDLEFGSPSVQSGGDILGDGVQLQTDAKQNVDSIIRPQRNASSCSFCSFDNSSLSFKSLDAGSLMDTALDLDQSAGPRSSVSASAAGQGPFQALFVQSLENSSAPYIDLFADATHLHPSTSSLEQNPSDVSISESKGWATFDLPQHISPTPTPVMSGDGVAQGNLSPLNNGLQLSSVQNFTTLGSFSSTANQWHGVAYGVQGPAGPTSSQLWNAFGDSNGSFNPASSENFLPNSELQGETQTLSASGNQDKNSRSLEESGKDGFRRSGADDLVAVPTVPVVGVTEIFFPLPVLPPMGGMPSNAHNQKSINPFDLAYDSEMESCSMFPDMGSLQAALPDAKMPAFLSGLNTSWFPQDPVLAVMPAVPQGGLTLFGAQGPTSQLPNLASQGSVAPLGGNPFA